MIKNKWNTLKKNNDGFSLIEMLVVIMLMMIMFSIVSSIFVVSLRLHTRANELAEVNTLLDNLSAIMLDDISGATEIVLEREPSAIPGVPDRAKTLIIHSPNSKLVYYDLTEDILVKGEGDPPSGLSTPPPSRKAVLDEMYYKGKSVQVDFFEADAPSVIAAAGTLDAKFIIRMTLSNNAGTLAERDYAVNRWN